MKINKKIIAAIFPLSEAEIQGLLHLAQANPVYFLAWFQSLRLPSAQSESPLAPKCRVSFKVNRIFHFSYSYPDYPTAGLTVTRLVRVYCILSSMRISFQ
jgi:hypothetical protein